MFLFMSISQLSESTGMSEATISRFARHMGYQDYKGLRNGIIKQQTKNGAAGKMQELSSEHLLRIQELKKKYDLEVIALR